MSDWIPLPPAQLLLRASAPLLVETDRLDDFRRYVDGRGAERVEIDITEATGAVDVIGAMKGVLTFPSWCGSSWDSIDDAFAEIRDAWHFPLVMVVHSLEALLDLHRHVGLETVLRLHELEQAFSTAGDQLVVVFAGVAWS
jgi:hypothetical protein